MIQDILRANKPYIISEYQNDRSLNSLAKEFKCNSGTVWYFLNSCGVEMQQRRNKNYGKIKLHKDEIIQLYEEGLTCYQISKKLGFSDSSTGKYMKQIGLDTARYCDVDYDNLLVDKKDAVIEMYKSGKSTIRIAKELGHCGASVRQLLNDNGIQCRSRVKYSMDHSFFSVIDNEFKAYVLGFMYADGNVNDKNYTFRIFQNEHDIHILYDIKHVVNYTGPLNFQQRIAPRKNLYTLQVSSEQCVKDLIRWGCVPNKSLILTWPDFLSDDLVLHFVRGYFDGDGSLSLSRNGLKIKTVGVTSNDLFCQGLNEYIKQKLNLVGKFYYRYSGKTSCGTWMLTKSQDCQKFLQWMYTLNNGSLFLKRKYDKYQRICY